LYICLWDHIGHLDLILFTTCDCVPICSISYSIKEEISRTLCTVSYSHSVVGASIGKGDKSEYVIIWTERRSCVW